MALNGHIQKIIVTDFHFGGRNLVYSTAEVLRYGIFDSEPMLALRMLEGGEFLIEGAKSGSVVASDGSKVEFVKSAKGLIINFKGQEGMTLINTSNGVRVLLMDRDTAHLFWVPPLTSDPTAPGDQLVFVRGPHLVRGAQLGGGVISLRGDSSETTAIEVFTVGQGRTSHCGNRRPRRVQVPKLGTWRVQDSLPESFMNYSDSGPAWVLADDMETPSKYKDATMPYLYTDQYGFHTGIHLWRGYFNGSADGVYLEVQGGIAQGWSAWLNGKFVGSFLGDLSSSTGSKELSFSNGTVSHGKNVLLVIQETTAHDQGSGSLNVRGIINATLLNSESGFTSWKIAGTAGDSSGTPLDTVRTRYNEGGLGAERLGWHLPGFDDSRWPESSPSDDSKSAGVRLYRTHLHLDTPAGHDVALSVHLNKGSNTTSTNFRAYLYINGYQYGRYYPYLNEYLNSFPAPPGIWNYDGDNLIALAVWNQEEAEVTCELEVNVDYFLASSLNVKFDGAYLRLGWDEERSRYA